MGPFRADFGDLSVVADHVIKLGSSSHSSPQQQKVELTDFDVNYFVRAFTAGWLFVFEYDIDDQKLLAALKTWAEANPMLTGRFEDSSSIGHPPLRVVTNDAGFPLRVSRWPSGSVGSFPVAVCLRDVHEGRMPGHVAPECPLLEYIDLEKCYSGREPLVKFSLTHLGDGGGGGSVFGINVCHSVADAGRTFQMLQDLSTVFRGGSIPPGLYQDRSHLQREALLSKLPPDLRSVVEETVQQLSSAIEAQVEVDRERLGEGEAASDTQDDAMKRVLWPWHIEGAEGCPEATGYNWECIHVPKQQFDEWKAAVEGHVAKYGCEFVSSNDLITAFMWLVRSRMYGWPLPGDKHDQGSMFGFPMDVVQNGWPDIVPKGYVGNIVISATAGPVPRDEEEGDANNMQDDNYYVDRLARAACAVRKAILQNRNHAAQAIGQLLAKATYTREAWVAMPEALRMPPGAGGTSNWSSYSLDKVDLGEGPPKGFVATCNYYANSVGVIVKALDGDGLYVQTVMEQPHVENIKKDPVMTRLAPHVRFL